MPTYHLTIYINGAPVGRVPVEFPEGYEPPEDAICLIPTTPQFTSRREQQRKVEREIDERIEEQNARERERYGTTVAPGPRLAKERARAGEDVVPYEYYRQVSRVLVKRDALERDFDSVYDRVRSILQEGAGCNEHLRRIAEAPPVAVEDKDFVHFGRPGRARRKS